MPAAVEGDDPVVLAERSAEVGEDAIAVGEAAVQQQHRLRAVVVPAVLVDPRGMTADLDVVTHPTIMPRRDVLVGCRRCRLPIATAAQKRFGIAGGPVGNTGPHGSAHPSAR